MSKNLVEFCYSGGLHSYCQKSLGFFDSLSSPKERAKLAAAITKKGQVSLTDTCPFTCFTNTLRKSGILFVYVPGKCTAARVKPF